MAEPLNIFAGSSGLNNKVDPARLPYDPDTGVQDLAVAYNVDHDQSGRISRRKGFAITARTEDIHSLFCDGGACLFVTGTSLCELHADYTHTVLTTVTAGAKMRYLQLGARLYYANGHETGYIEDGTAQSWVKGTYQGPETDRQFSNPPIGSRLAFHAGHMYVVQGNIVWHSEPYGINFFDLARGFLPFESEVRMFRPVIGGIYVGTEAKTLFLRGKTPAELRFETIATYPPIEDTDVELDLSKLGGEFYGVGIVWTSTNGICAGLPDGRIFNLTERKLVYPSALRGAAVATQDKYVALLEP